MSSVQFGNGTNGSMQPSAQMSRSHSGNGGCKDREQGVLFTTLKIAIYFQISPRRGIEKHRVGEFFFTDAAYMGQAASLRIF